MGFPKVCVCRLVDLAPNDESVWYFDFVMRKTCSKWTIATVWKFEKAKMWLFCSIFCWFLIFISENNGKYLSLLQRNQNNIWPFTAIFVAILWHCCISLRLYIWKRLLSVLCLEIFVFVFSHLVSLGILELFICERSGRSSRSGHQRAAQWQSHV